MSKHTPGPWVIIPGGDEWNQGRIATIEPKPEAMVETNYWTVAEVNHRRHEHAANAKLIAAAPDLFKKLSTVIENEEQSCFEQWLSRISPSGDCDSVHAQWLDSYDYEDFCDLWKGPISAIARAKGV